MSQDVVILTDVGGPKTEGRSVLGVTGVSDVDLLYVQVARVVGVGLTVWSPRTRPTRPGGKGCSDVPGWTDGRWVPRTLGTGGQGLVRLTVAPPEVVGCSVGRVIVAIVH